MDEDAYHAHPALSSTNARRILESPAKYRWAQTHEQEPKPAFDLGHAVHSKVLGVGAQTVVIPEDVLASNRAVSTVAAQEFIAQARADGLIPVKQEVADEVDAMAEAVLAHPTAAILLGQFGNPEVSAFAIDPETELELRARFDFLPAGGDTPVAVDLKTARDASPAGFTRAAAEHGYAIQRGHYMYVHQLAGDIELDGFVFVAVETTPPYLVGIHRLRSTWETRGVEKAREARLKLRDCLATDTWPGYGDEIHSLTEPFWLIANDAEAE